MCDRALETAVEQGCGPPVATFGSGATAARGATPARGRTIACVVGTAIESSPTTPWTSAATEESNCGACALANAVRPVDSATRWNDSANACPTVAALADTGIVRPLADTAPGFRPWARSEAATAAI